MMTSPHDTLLIGAGDLGTEIGLRLAAAGHGVVAVRRRARLVPEPLIGLVGDVEDGLPDLPEFCGLGGGPRFLVVCLTAGGRDEAAYRRIFLDALTRVLDDVRARGWQPERALFVSSTGVCAQHGDITEDTPAEPSSPTSQVLLEAEELFATGLPEPTVPVVVRPSGLYGPGREWFVEQVRNGRVTDPARMTHRVHRDDVARAIVHLLTMPDKPDPLYLVTDDAPAPAGEVARFIAERIGASPDLLDAGRTAVVTSAPGSGWVAADGGSAAPDTRRLHNDRLRATGFSFTYPSYREGYSAVLAGGGERHP